MTDFRQSGEASFSRGDAGSDRSILIDELPIAVAIATLNSSFTIQRANDQFSRLFGYTLGDVPTVREWANRVFPDIEYRRRMFEAWEAFVAQARRGGDGALECSAMSKEGGIRKVAINAAASGDRLFVTFTDITAGRQTGEELRRLTAHLERTAYEITESIPVGTYTMVQPADGGMGFFSFLSRRFLDICGLDADEARSDPFKAFACVHPDDYEAWVRKNAEVFANKLPFSGECRVVVKGEVRWVSAESIPRDLPDGSTVWEGVLIDITQQKLAETALSDALEAERQQAERRRGELEQKLKASLSAAAAAHEIKQPLTRILLETQGAMERMRQRSSDEDEILSFLEDILEESRAVVGMVNRMKAVLRNAHSTHRQVDISEVVAGAILRVQDLLRDHGCTVHERNLDRHVSIVGDGPQLQTALINIIRNAVEAVAGQPPTRRDVAIAITVGRDDVEIAVGDSGPVMAAEQIANLPFVTTKPDGTGLGLYLARTCVENHGGTIAVARSPYGGAEVRLHLPLERSLSR
jgi:PAS domain S-box-containing protein